MKRTHFLWRGLLLSLGLGLTLFGLGGSAQAACGPGNLSEFCSANYGLLGNLSAVGSATSNTLPAVDNSQLPTVGALFYADYKALEEQARDLLQRNMKFRQDISPYRQNNNFNKLVRQFDINAGYSAPYDDPDPAIAPMTLQQRIDLADSDLRLARNLYAFLAVYAPEARMRADNGTDSVPGANYKEVLCAQAENPNPPDPTKSGQVLEPIIDWCNFPARLRQSVREAAYLRMIFAQQFMVDALGLHFSAGALIGGEDFVRQEVAKLDAAKHQFALADQGLREALGHSLGSGCLISDFYTQTEWLLLSRAVQGQEVAQHHIATRLSYLDIKTDADIPLAQAAAQDAYRTASVEGYLKLVSLAGTAAVGASSGGC
ncbi:MAG TPA: hypothetical protein GYA08_11945, partial [Chloroflexi bacterium]|nr:hypothetical protein [Chloroflexota bacterium]